MGRKTKFVFSTMIYSLLFSLCLYKNLGGITFLIYSICNVIYIRYNTALLGQKTKKDNLFAEIALVLIGLSQFLTSNEVLWFFNFVASFVLTLYIVLHQFSEDNDWSLLRNIGQIISTVFLALCDLFKPFSDYSEFKSQNREDHKKLVPIITVFVTLLVSIPIVIIIICLLSSADIVFSNLVSDTLSKIFSFDLVLFALLTLFVFLYVYALIEYLKNRRQPGEENLHTKDPLVGITLGILLDLVYVVFSIIQVFYLFIGKFEIPNGYTYAQYAREGYFQLLFVCLINVIFVIIGCHAFRTSKILKPVLSIMCLCTYVMIASSAFRMILYIRYYHFSFLRIFVLWSLVVIALCMTGLMVYIIKPEFKLFSFAFRVITVCYIVLAFSHFDYLIADWNINGGERFGETFFIDSANNPDYDYLYDLSYDAAPVLLCDENFLNDCTNSDIYIENIARNCKTNIRNFNIAKYIAYKGTKKTDFFVN